MNILNESEAVKIIYGHVKENDNLNVNEYFKVPEVKEITIRNKNAS